MRIPWVRESDSEFQEKRLQPHPPTPSAGPGKIFGRAQGPPQQIPGGHKARPYGGWDIPTG